MGRLEIGDLVTYAGDDRGFYRGIGYVANTGFYMNDSRNPVYLVRFEDGHENWFYYKDLEEVPVSSLH